MKINRELALRVYLLREKGKTFIDIAREIGGISGHDAARLWLLVKDARDAYNNREKVVYRKRHINKNHKPKKVVDKPLNPVMMDAFRNAKAK